MTKRSLCCLICCIIASLAAAWLAHAEPPEVALPVPTAEPVTVEEDADTQPDKNAPWPTSPVPAYSTPRQDAGGEQDGSAGADVVPAGGPEPPGYLPLPDSVAPLPADSAEPISPIRPTRPRWQGLFGR